MLTVRAGTKHLIREINQAIVLDTIRSHGALSRTEVAARTDLSQATVSGIVGEMIDAGLLYEQSTGVSTGGRRPIYVAFNERAAYAVGVKLTERTAVAVLTDLNASVVAQHHAPIPDHTPAAVAGTVVEIVQTLRSAAGEQPILGVGLGLAGVVDYRREVVRFATYYGWENLPLGSMLEAELDLPVVLDNDVNALAVAEHWFGAGRGIADFLALSIGRGVGLGMILNGRLYRGSAGGAGEFGHTVIVPDGPTCACGKRGCLEALVSDGALAARAAALAGRPLGIEEAVRLGMQGQPEIAAMFADAARILGMAVANLVNVLNPALIIVGGEGMRAGSLIMQPFQAALLEHSFGSLAHDVRVVSEPWGDDAWARGAASLLLSEVFQPPLHRGDEERPSLTTPRPA
jgi:predicted NBD/HSP70 family sugar kinase